MSIKCIVLFVAKFQQNLHNHFLICVADLNIPKRLYKGRKPNLSCSELQYLQNKQKRLKTKPWWLSLLHACGWCSRRAWPAPDSRCFLCIFWNLDEIKKWLFKLKFLNFQTLGIPRKAYKMRKWYFANTEESGRYYVPLTILTT